MSMLPEDLNIAEVMSEYIALKEQERELTGRLKSLSTLILMLLDPEEAPSIWHKGYNFTHCQRRSWEYPAEVQALEKELKKAKKKAEGDGSAVASYSTYLRLTAESAFSEDT